MNENIHYITYLYMITEASRKTAMCSTITMIVTCLRQEHNNGIVPGGWKTFLICPISPKNSPSNSSIYRPIAITSVVMKRFEKIILPHLSDLTNGMQDPFQFAYKPNRSIEDTILSLLHNIFLHANNPKSYVRIIFASFFRI